MENNAENYDGNPREKGDELSWNKGRGRKNTVWNSQPNSTHSPLKSLASRLTHGEPIQDSHLIPLSYTLRKKGPLSKAWVSQSDWQLASHHDSQQFCSSSLPYHVINLGDVIKDLPRKKHNKQTHCQMQYFRSPVNVT
jgi:hypothetical protein